MPPVINEDKCSHCGSCFDVCQSDVFFGSKKGEIPAITFPEECWHCTACELACPVEGAISVRIPLPAMLLFR